MVLLTEPLEHPCRRYMRSTECPSSYQNGFIDRAVGTPLLEVHALY